MTNNGVRDTTNKSPSYPAQPPTTHHYQPNTYVLGEVYDLSLRASHTEVSLHYTASGRFDPLYLGVQYFSSLLLNVLLYLLHVLKVGYDIPGVTVI